MSKDATRFEWATPQGECERAGSATGHEAVESPWGETPSAGGLSNAREEVSSRSRSTTVSDAHSGSSEDDRIRWRFRADGPIETEPTVDSGTLYLGCADGCTYALDADDGTTRWTFHSGGRVTAPTVGDEVAYVGTNAGTLFAIDTGTGDERWRYHAPDAIEASPVADEEAVYVAADDGRVAALHPADGAPLRTFRNAGRAPCSLALDGERLLFASLDGGAYARDRADGRERWRFKPAVAVHGSPLVASGTAYLGTVDDGRLYAISAVTGREQWHVTTDADIWSSPVVADGTVYVGGGDGNLYAFDAADGTEQWRFDTGERVWSSPALDGDVLYVGNDAGDLYAVGKQTGTVAWHVQVGDAIVASPVVAGGTVYVADCGGTVYAVDS
ncbi:outer membrane protein assembly factor BamB family protein [Halorussus halophilus]|uniref:outer membrane protein assembly factor BamB family protein n=1 Tax=Halorussus halophilus TaxID=2650975 RepID=UPI001300D736|nr:PQQ-binding-like beta-propeller repeat protein [Halorussus halophilus]